MLGPWSEPTGARTLAHQRDAGLAKGRRLTGPGSASPHSLEVIPLYLSVQMFGLLLVLLLPCSCSYPGRVGEAKMLSSHCESPADGQTVLADHQTGAVSLVMVQVLPMSMSLGDGKVGP